MNSSTYIDHKGKHILILGEGPTQGLDNATLVAEAKYLTDFSRSQGKFCSSLHYNESNFLLFVNATKIYQCKAKDYEIKKYPLCLGNASKGFTSINVKKAGLNGYVYEFSNDYNIIDIHKYLMKKT